MTASAAPKPHRRLWLLALVLVVVPILLFTLYVGLAFTWSYSDGERAGVLQKFSRKGWLCKTWEGELAMTTMPGTAPQIFSATCIAPPRGARGNTATTRSSSSRATMSLERIIVPTTCATCRTS